MLTFHTHRLPELQSLAARLKILNFQKFKLPRIIVKFDFLLLFPEILHTVGSSLNCLNKMSIQVEFDAALELFHNFS